jgi:hemolysin III
MLQILDHASINLLIAASYTPFMLISNGDIMLTIVWVIAVLNVLDMLYTQRVSNLNVVKYLVMGWMLMLNIGAVYDAVPFSSFASYSKYSIILNFLFVESEDI